MRLQFSTESIVMFEYYRSIVSSWRHKNTEYSTKSQVYINANDNGTVRIDKNKSVQNEI